MSKGFDSMQSFKHSGLYCAATINGLLDLAGVIQQSPMLCSRWSSLSHPKISSVSAILSPWQLPAWASAGETTSSRPSMSRCPLAWEGLEFYSPVKDVCQNIVSSQKRWSVVMCCTFTGYVMNQTLFILETN